MRKKNATGKVVKNEPTNQALIEDFLTWCKVTGIGELRRKKYKSALKKIDGWLNKPFLKATKSDIEKLVGHIIGNGYQAWTVHDYKVCVKKFFRWLYKKDYNEDPEITKWIRTTLSRRERKDKLPSELLTPKEVQTLVDSAETMRDKLFIAMLYESGCRVGELITLKLKGIMIKDNYYSLTVNGKTGMRRIPALTNTLPMLKTYLDRVHKSKDNTETYLFYDKDPIKALSYSAVRMFLQRLKKRICFKKAINPHLFRASRATYLSKFLSNQELQSYFGWNDAATIKTYVSLSQENVKNRILEIHGLQQIKQEALNEELKPKKCVCGTLCSNTDSFCTHCGRNIILDSKEALLLQKQEEMAAQFLVGLKELEKTNNPVFKVIQDLGRKTLD